MWGIWCVLSVGLLHARACGTGACMWSDWDGGIAAVQPNVLVLLAALRFSICIYQNPSGLDFFSFLSRTPQGVASTLESAFAIKLQACAPAGPQQQQQGAGGLRYPALAAIARGISDEERTLLRAIRGCIQVRSWGAAGRGSRYRRKGASVTVSVSVCCGPSGMHQAEVLGTRMDRDARGGAETGFTVGKERVLLPVGFASRL